MCANCQRRETEARNRKTGLLRLSKKLSGAYARNGRLTSEQTKELEDMKAKVEEGKQMYAQAQAGCLDES